jgi:hypothetical protein
MNANAIDISLMCHLESIEHEISVMKALMYVDSEYYNKQATGATKCLPDDVEGITEDK